MQLGDYRLREDTSGDDVGVEVFTNEDAIPANVAAHLENGFFFVGEEFGEEQRCDGAANGVAARVTFAWFRFVEGESEGSTWYGRSVLGS